MRLIARAAFTVVELLVVIFVIGLLTAILLPAIMAAREAAHKAECKNNLRQIGTAVHLHHDKHGHLPTNGWGYQWAGDPDRGYGQDQPGGWIYNLLPYVEHQPLRDLGKNTDDLSKRLALRELLQRPISLFNCPSRRPSKTHPYTEDHFPLRNVDPAESAAKTDYAICAGDKNIHTRGGPSSLDANVVQSYTWPNFWEMTGVSYVRSQVTFGEITDGLSNTCLVGEKYVGVVEATDSLGDDQAMYIGDDADNRRWTSAPPVSDRENVTDIEHFGSRHVDGCHFVFCDISVRSIGYNVDAKLFRSMGNRHDRLP